MKDQDKTKKQLINELGELRQGISKLERFKTIHLLTDKKLKESEKKHRDLVQTIPECVYNATPDGEILYMSPAVKNIFGYTAEEFKKDKNLWISRIHKDDQKELLAKIDKTLKKGEPYIHEFRMKRKDGKIVWIRDHCNTILDKKGRLIKVTGIIFNITNQKREEQKLLKARNGLEKRVKKRTTDFVEVNKRLQSLILELRQAEEELRKREEQFRLAFENARDAVLWGDPETGTIINCNKAAESLLERDRKEIIGLHQTMIHSPEKKKYYAEMFKTHIEQKGAFDEDAEIITKKGKIKPVHISASVTSIGKKSIIQGIFRDITEIKESEEALKKSERKYRTLFEGVPAGLYRTTRDGRILDANPILIKMLGYPNKKSLMAMNAKDIYIAHEDRKRSLEILDRDGVIRNFEHRLKRNDGEVIWVQDTTHSVFDDKGNVLFYEGSLQDITERKLSDNALRESEERYRAIFEQAADSVVLINGKTGRFVEFNTLAHENLGYSREEFQKLRIPNFEVIESSKEVTSHIKKIIKEGTDTFETKHRTKAGDIRDIQVRSRAISIHGKDFIMSIWRDITEQKRAEEKIKASLKEKEVLLKEVHHRVKNNMQIISSLINLQARSIKDKDILEMFKACRERIRSMALIHESLYRSKDLARIDFSYYIKKISTHVISIYGEVKGDISLNQEVKNVYLDINTAIPCGLIINELVSNSLRHAFPGGKGGKIVVKMIRDRSGKYKLIVKDTGIGLPKGLDFKKTETLGLQLVRDLTDQIDGTIKLDRKDGTTFKITF